MSRKVVELGWTLVDENIENVERVRLEPSMQRELGCTVGEHVFLEYPWAYVDREAVERLARSPDSPLAPFLERIQAYEADAFLVGYSSEELVSEQFVICLTEDAKREVLRRNRRISRGILRRVQESMSRRAANDWSSLGSDAEISESYAKKTRGLFEIEITFPGKLLGSRRSLRSRDSGSCRDGYAQLVSEDEHFRIVRRRCVSRSVQTNLENREAFAQTHLRDTKNACTQYAYEDSSKAAASEEDPRAEDREDGSQDEGRPPGEDADLRSGERTALEIFLESRSSEVIDIVRYNAAVNLHVDDVRNLSQHGRPFQVISKPSSLREQVSFLDLNATSGRAVSDVSVHPKFIDHLVISYAFNRTGSAKHGGENEFRAGALLWKLSDPLGPRLILQDHREIHSVCFCPRDGELVIGGCSTGQLVIWSIGDFLGKDARSVELGATNRSPALRPFLVSDRQRSHRLPVRQISWLPIARGTNGSDDAPSSLRCLTASEDHEILVWNLSIGRPTDIVNSEDSLEPFRPVHRLTIPLLSNTEERPLPRSWLPPFGSDSRTVEHASGEVSCFESFWIGCREGLIRCTWKESPAGEAEKYPGVHDGPVTGISRSPHLRDVLLTVGGRVFAVWKEDYRDSPLLWRRTSSRYATCCWANTPGVFWLGGRDGSLEMWDLKSDLRRAVLSQVVSSEPVTCLTLLRCPGVEGSSMIGVGDRRGLFRALREPENFEEDTSTDRSEWFEAYARRERERKEAFVNWQSDLLARDSAVGRKTREDGILRREADGARKRFQDRESRSRSGVRSAEVPKDVARWSEELRRMQGILLAKRRLDPVEIEAKRQPLVAANRERDAILRKIQEKISESEAHYSSALSVEFPEIPGSPGDPAEESIPLSIDRLLERFSRARCRARDSLRNDSGTLNDCHLKMKFSG